MMAFCRIWVWSKKGIIKRSTDSTAVRFLVRQNVTSQQKKQKKLARHAATSTNIVCICDWLSVLDLSFQFLPLRSNRQLVWSPGDNNWWLARVRSSAQSHLDQHLPHYRPTRRNPVLFPNGKLWHYFASGQSIEPVFLLIARSLSSLHFYRFLSQEGHHVNRWLMRFYLDISLMTSFLVSSLYLR